MQKDQDGWYIFLTDRLYGNAEAMNYKRYILYCPFCGSLLREE